jgi:hypothetical protein
MNELTTPQESKERELITDPHVLMQRFFTSDHYHSALTRFKEGKNPEIPDERYRKVFNETEYVRCHFINFVQDGVIFGYSSKHYPPQVLEALEMYMEHVQYVQRQNRYIRDRDSLQSDDELRTRYHREVATQLELAGITPSRELAKGLASAILYAAGYDNLASAKDSSIRRAHIALNG